MQLDALRNLSDGKQSIRPLIDLLLSAQPLTAKQIYFALKKRENRPVSYQATHKQLQALLNERILKKESLEYSINPQWFEDVEQTTKEVKTLLKQREDIVKYTRQKKIKIISFDLGGALFDNHYDELLWRTAIPEAYARRYKISKQDAFERVTAEYRRLWGKVNGWRDPVFWFRHFDINCTLEELTKRIKKHIVPYHDVLPLIKRLSKSYKLIIITHAQRNLIEQKLMRAGIKNHFFKIYSTGEDFEKITKDAEVYRRVCEDLGIELGEMMHVGNKYDLDYIIPSDLGVRAILIDRVGDRKDTFVIRDLYELEDKLHEAEHPW